MIEFGFTPSLKVRALACKLGGTKENPELITMTKSTFQFQGTGGYFQVVCPKLELDPQWFRSITEEIVLLVQDDTYPRTWEVVVKPTEKETWELSTNDTPHVASVILGEGVIFSTTTGQIEGYLWNMFGDHFHRDNPEMEFLP
jgi:hypothetical protein